MRLAPTASSPWWHSDFNTALGGSTLLDDDRIEIDRTAILLSAHRSLLARSPEQVESGLRLLDDLASRCVEHSVEVWHRLLFVELGLSGNGIDYHDVRNSFLLDVLDRKVGIPISLAVVGLAVGRRLGLRVFGVGMPGHYLLGHRIGDLAAFIDPFHGGMHLTAEGVSARFTAMFGERQEFDVEFLRPTTTVATLIRMLANLKQNYARTRDLPGLLDVMRLRSSLPDFSITEGRELARLLHATDAPNDALEICDQVEFHHPSARALIDVERDRIMAGFN